MKAAGDWWIEQMPKEEVGKPQRPNMSTVWVSKDTIDVLKQYMIVLGAKNLDEAMGRLVDHFRECPKGLDPRLRDMLRRMEALKAVRLQD